jgi:hypothetical protein
MRSPHGSASPIKGGNGGLRRSARVNLLGNSVATLGIEGALDQAWLEANS